MSALLGFNRHADYREADMVLPDAPVSMPYELRTEMSWFDFGTPTNPLGTPREIIQAMHRALVGGELAYVPDGGGHVLRDAVGEALGLDSQWIMAGTSASQLIEKAALAFRQTAVGVTAPCPPEYLTAVSNAGHSFVELVNPVSFATLDAYTAQAKYGPFKGVVLANPSYPASRLLSKEALIGYLETCSWVILDESYIELSFGGESLVPLVRKYSNLIVVRSPSVTFGMPGVPVGYLVANPKVVKQIRRFSDGSDLTMFSEVLAKEFFMQRDYLERTHEFLDGEIPWMQCMISLVPGVRVYPAEGSFVLCEFNLAEEMRLGVTGLEELVVRLQLAGYLVRPLDGFAGLPGGTFFSVAVRSREDNEGLIAAMRRIVSTIG